MIDLLDVNVWLALADANHPHYNRANRYWTQESALQVGFCRITMLGFLRLSTHKNVLSRPLHPQEAWEIYRKYLSTEGITFLSEPNGLDAMLQSELTATFENSLWTDAYLASFARKMNIRMVSFDRDFFRFKGLSFLHLTA